MQVVDPPTLLVPQPPEKVDGAHEEHEQAIAVELLLLPRLAVAFQEEVARSLKAKLGAFCPDQLQTSGQQLRLHE